MVSFLTAHTQNDILKPDTGQLSQTVNLSDIVDMSERLWSWLGLLFGMIVSWKLLGGKILRLRRLCFAPETWHVAD